MTTDGLLPVHFRREGGNGTVPLVLLHGFPLDHRMWDDVVDLIPGGRAVLCVDLPGFGGAPRGQDVAEAMGHALAPSLDAAADALAATLRDAGLSRVAVVGLSMGGYVAMAFLERHPELVAGIGLVDTKSSADGDEAVAGRLRTADAVERADNLDAVLGMRTALLGATNRSTRPDLAERLESWIRDQGPVGVAWAQRAMAARPDRTAVLESFVGPSVVIVGDEDELAPVAAAEHLRDALSHGAAGLCELVIVPRAGHMTSIEAPEPVAVALASLARRADELG